MSLSQFVIPAKVTIPKGAYGVWQIPELKIMIPVYQANSSNAQKIADKENSAIIQKLGVGRMIGDHLDAVSMNGKGVWNVSEFKPDITGFLVTAKGTFRYVSKYVCRAVRHTNCYMMDNIPQWPKSSTDIFCVSCTDTTAKDVYLAAFRYAGKMPS